MQSHGLQRKSRKTPFRSEAAETGSAGNSPEIFALLNTIRARKKGGAISAPPFLFSFDRDQTMVPLRCILPVPV